MTNGTFTYPNKDKNACEDEKQQLEKLNELMVSFPSPSPEMRVAAGGSGMMKIGIFKYLTKDKLLEELKKRDLGLR